MFQIEISKINLWFFLMSLFSPLESEAQMIPFGFLKTQYADFGVQSFNKDQSYYILNSSYLLVLQSDGNFVLYRASGGALWATSTYGNTCSPNCTANFQSDGNLVVKQGSTTLFTTGLTGASGAILRISPTKPYVKIILNNNVLWNSGP